MDKDLLSIAEARELSRRAKAAFALYRTFDQERVDRITYAVVEAGYHAAASLARLAVEETGIGRVSSKTAKNQFGTRGIWKAIREQRTCGIIREDSSRGLMEVADPFGVVAAIMPTTNPTSTALFKAIICIKSRNAMVAAPHPRAVRCVMESVRIAHDAAVSAGAPRDLLLSMGTVSLEGTQALMKDDNVDLILATGGGALVKAAYSSGKPAFGVGPGNVPVYVDRSADIEHAARCLVESQTFDNSTLCTSEQSVVCDRPVADALLAALKKRKAHIATDEEARKLESLVWKGNVPNTEIVGLDASKIATMAGFEVPSDTTVLVAPTEKIGKAHPLSREKLCPVLAFFRADGFEEGCRSCIELLNVGGRGHTLGMHCENDAIVRAFALEKPVNRILVNSPTAQGGVGYTTALFPSLTLGCGSFGGNITSDNIGPQHLINIKRVAYAHPAYRAGGPPEALEDLPPIPPANLPPAVGSAWDSRDLDGRAYGIGPLRSDSAARRNPAELRPAEKAPLAGQFAQGPPGEHFPPGELERIIREGLSRRHAEKCPFPPAPHGSGGVSGPVS